MITPSEKIRIGMVGGGTDAFIGNVHRMVMRLHGGFDLVCGAFSSDKERSHATGKELGIQTDRRYGDWQTMLEVQSNLDPEVRMQAVVIVTPNHLHFPVAKRALELGFHVICDKPATLTLAEAVELQALLAASNEVRRGIGETELLFCLTHNYTGYPLVRQMRQMLEHSQDRDGAGPLGPVRAIRVQYLQGWLAQPIENEQQKQASWRTDPNQSGATCAIGDIGVHALNLMRFCCPRLSVEHLYASLRTAVPGRKLDDNATVMMRLSGNIPVTIEVSQVSLGHENDLKIEIDCARGGLTWRQEDPNTLTVHHLNLPSQVFRAGNGYLCQAASSSCLLPPGHTEGYLGAFAQVYDALVERFSVTEGKVYRPDTELKTHMPDINDAVEGMLFIASCVESSKSAHWVRPADILSGRYFETDYLP